MTIASWMLRALPIALAAGLLLAARPAWAGYCGEEGMMAAVNELEAYARKPGKEKPTLYHLCMEEMESEPKLQQRILAGCTKVLAREPDFAPCVQWSVTYGAKKLGDVELFGKVGELFKLDPFVGEDFPLTLYLSLDDARAVPLALEAWKAALLDKRAAKDRYRYSFTKFRHAAIKLMARHGGAGERAFLDEQGKAIKDRGIKKAIGKAIAEIDKRAASPT